MQAPKLLLNNALTGMNEALAPLFTTVAEFVTIIANWATQNPVLAGTIVAIVTVLGILIGIALAVTSAFALASASGITLAGVMAVLTSPITLVIAIIIALIAIGIALYKNWGTIQEKGRALNKTVSEAFSNMRKAVSEKMQEIWTKIKEIWGKVQAFFEGIDLKQIGKDIISGLISGITAKATELYRKATEIASNISKKIRKALDSKSPSRVTMAIGEDVGDGLAIGMQNTMGTISAMSTRMAKMAVPEVEPRTAIATTGATSAGNNFVVNLNSPKALDVREANKVFNRTVNKMSLMW